MKKPLSRRPPSGAPDGTVWLGGPVDRWKVTLRIFGEDLDPDHISAVLGCEPSSAARKGDPFPRTGRWLLTIDSRNCAEEDDVDDGVRMLLARLPSSPAVWASLASRYRVEISCSLFLEAINRGFSIPAEISALLADRGIEIGFDVYFDPQA